LAPFNQAFVKSAPYNLALLKLASFSQTLSKGGGGTSVAADPAVAPELRTQPLAGTFTTLVLTGFPGITLRKYNFQMPAGPNPAAAAPVAPELEAKSSRQHHQSTPLKSAPLKSACFPFQVRLKRHISCFTNIFLKSHSVITVPSLSFPLHFFHSHPSALVTNNTTATRTVILIIQCKAFIFSLSLFPAIILAFPLAAPDPCGYIATTI